MAGVPNEYDDEQMMVLTPVSNHHILRQQVVILSKKHQIKEEVKMLAFAAHLRNIVFLIVFLFSFSGIAFAGIVVEDKPVSLLGMKVVMENGKPCIMLSDLASALGGTLVVNQKARTVSINPGPKGTLKLNTKALSALSAQRGLSSKTSALNTPDLSKGRQEGLHSVQLKIGGVTVSVRREEEEEHLLLRPNPMMPLASLAEMLGGKARLDAGKNQWLLPVGSEVTAISLRKTAGAVGGGGGPNVPPIGNPRGQNVGR